MQPHATTDHPSWPEVRPSTRGAGTTGWQLWFGCEADPLRLARGPPGRPILPAASSSDAIALPQPAGLLAPAAIASELAAAPPQRMPLPLAYLELVARLYAPRPASTGSSRAV